MTNKARRKRKELGVRTGHRRRGAANALRPAADPIQVSSTSEATVQRGCSPDPVMGRTFDAVPATVWAEQIDAFSVNSRRKAHERPEFDSAASALAKRLDGASANSAIDTAKKTKDLLRNPLVEAIERTERMFRNPLVEAIERTERMFCNPFQSYLDKMERVYKNPYEKYEDRRPRLRGDDETRDP